MELLAHYKGFIESVPGNVVTDSGNLMRETSEGLKPVVWEGKEVVLPTSSFLANPDWNKYMPFHPMCESIARGESDIIQLSLTMVRISLWEHFIDIARALLQIAADQSMQTKLTPTQQKYLSSISEADPTTVENFLKIIAKSKHDYSDGIDRRIIALYLRRGGSQDGQHYSRMFRVAFPLYDELCKAEEAKDAKDRKVFDVALRVKDIPVLKALHEIIFPGDESAYSIGTNSNLAPYYTALLSGYSNMARQLNTIMKPFIKAVKSLKLIDLSWDVGDDLTMFRNKIPPLPHNEGNDPVAAAETTAVAQPVQAQPAMSQSTWGQPAPQQQPVTTLSAMNQPQQQPMQPAQQPQPATTPTIGSANPQHQAKDGKVSWGELSKSNAQPVPNMGYPQPGYGYPQQPGMMMQPGMVMQPPMMPQQQFMQPGMPQQMYQQPMQQPYGSYQPVMSNGMPQPPMPPTTQPAPQQQPMQMAMPGYGQQMYMQPQQMMMPQQQFIQPGMQQMYGQQPMMPGYQQPVNFPLVR